MNFREQREWERVIKEAGEAIKTRLTDLDARIDELEAEVNQLKSEPRLSLSRKLRIMGKTL